MKHCNLSFLLAIAACLMSFQAIYSADNNVRLYSYEDDSGSYYITVCDDTLTLSGLILDDSGSYQTLEFVPCEIEKDPYDKKQSKNSYMLYSLEPLIMADDMELDQTWSDSVPDNHIRVVFEFSENLSGLELSLSNLGTILDNENIPLVHLSKQLDSNDTANNHCVMDVDLYRGVTHRPDITPSLTDLEFHFDDSVRFCPRFFIPSKVNKSFSHFYNGSDRKRFTLAEGCNLITVRLPNASIRNYVKNYIDFHRINFKKNGLVLLGKEFKRVSKFNKPTTANTDKI